MQEIWKDIKGYEGLYQVSNFGRVKSFNRWRNSNLRYLSLTKDKDGYLIVRLYKNKKSKTYKVHRLVAESFLYKHNCTEVNHKNGIKNDNHVDNLEWCTHLDNMYHCNNVLGKNRKKKVICIETGTVFDSTRDAANFYNGNHSHLTACLRQYKYVKTFAKLHWKYI